MEDILLPNEFLNQSAEGVVVDVRTPAEFEAGHIPGAINLPLFSNEERVEVGTLYVQVGKEQAVQRGLELVGPKMASLVVQAREIARGKPLYLYCWRGGMRSGSMAWLFRTAGLRAILLKGGYKAYRNSFFQMLKEVPWKMVVVGGPTGCGKTDILHYLEELGHQVIDLEGLAHHKGSAFGNLGETAQPTTEQFANDLYHCMRKLDPTKPVWCEGESSTIGKVYMPHEFRLQMLAGTFIKLESDLSFRIENITKDYGHFPDEELIASFWKLEERMGVTLINRAVEHIREERLEDAIMIALNYYDKGYSKSIAKTWPRINTYVASINDFRANALGILEYYKKIE